jgi:putative flippase GtrA
MRALLAGKPRNAGIQFVRYAFVGGVAAVADTGCLYMLHQGLRINHLVAAAVGFLLGLLVNYLFSIAWVFESRGRRGRELFLFGLIGVGGLLWTEVILWIGVNLAHAPVMLGKLCSLVLVLIWNFGMRRTFVFAPDERPG